MENFKLYFYVLLFGLYCVGGCIYLSLKEDGFFPRRTKPKIKQDDDDCVVNSPIEPTSKIETDVKKEPASPSSQTNSKVSVVYTQPKIHKPEYEKFLDLRNIKYLVHFTDVDNLSNIFKFGIVPRSEHQTCGLEPSYNDFQRLDGHLGASSFTFSFPNYKYFYSMRQRFFKRDFAVLLVDAKVICELRTAFYSTNAASFPSTTSIPHETLAALELMFDEACDNLTTRIDCHTPSCYSTDPQAEVMVYGTISAKYIRAVYFSNEHTLRRYSSIIPNDVKAGVDYNLFDARCDAQHWKGRKFRAFPNFDWFDDFSTLITPEGHALSTVAPKKPSHEFIAEINTKAEKSNSTIEKSCNLCMEYISERCFGGGLCDDYRYSGREQKYS